MKKDLTLRTALLAHVIHVLKTFDGNRAKTAKRLDIPGRSLRHYIKEAKEKGYNVPKHQFEKEQTNEYDGVFPSNKKRLKHLDDIINKS